MNNEPYLFEVFFRPILEGLDNLEKYEVRLKKWSELISTTIKEFEECKTLLPDKKYDEVFKYIENGTSELQKINTKLEIIKNRSENIYKNIFKMIDSLNAQFVVLASKTNENKLKYGLQGNIKINKLKYTDLVKEEPNEYIRNHLRSILEDPIIETPFNQNAGKKNKKNRQTIKTNKKNKKKRQTIKINKI